MPDPRLRPILRTLFNTTTTTTTWNFTHKRVRKHSFWELSQGKEEWGARPPTHTHTLFCCLSRCATESDMFCCPQIHFAYCSVVWEAFSLPEQRGEGSRSGCASLWLPHFWVIVVGRQPLFSRGHRSYWLVFPNQL